MIQNRTLYYTGRLYGDSTIYCLGCCGKRFKSAVNESSVGRAPKKPKDWICRHPKEAGISTEQLVDILICLNPLCRARFAIE